MANRLDAVAEEAMLTFGPTDESRGGKDRRRLLLVAHKEKDSAGKSPGSDSRRDA